MFMTHLQQQQQQRKQQQQHRHQHLQQQLLQPYCQSKLSSGFMSMFKK